MPTWPGTLPQRPMRSGYQETLPENVIRTTMDAGPPKVRRRFSSGVRQFRVRYEMTSAQVTTFDSFIENDIEARSLSFDWPHPRTQATLTGVRITSPPVYEPIGIDWIVSLALEYQETP